MIFKKDLIGQMTARVVTINRHSKKIVVFPEIDDKILQASSILVKKGICHPIILGKEDKLRLVLERLKIKNLNSENFYDYLDPKHISDMQDFVQAYIDVRKKDGKDVSVVEAKEKMQKPHFYAAMMVQREMADGMISGINSETKPYFPAFEIIKTREGFSRASGVFLMEKGEQVYLFADCALNINPTVEQLAETALVSSETAISFGIKPRVAMLSFSTHGTAKHEMVDKIVKATELVKSKDKDLIVDGEIQFDAAIIPAVAEKKSPNSPLHGQANVLIFPDLNSGNIGYKIAERLGGYKAIGPIMQGLNKPVNDLSRGASVQDIVDLAVITIIQGL
ncbi:MAG: phosphate acetyltransferase [Candidatus Woesearchaeota archaeon]